MQRIADFFADERRDGGALFIRIPERPVQQRPQIEAKLRRYLSCCLTLYHVPEGKQQEAITTILNMNLRTIAEHVIENTITRAEDGFEAAIHAKKP